MYGYLLAAWLGVRENLYHPCPQLLDYSVDQLVMPIALSWYHSPTSTPIPCTPVRDYSTDLALESMF